jgi:hypothetical protein
VVARELEGDAARVRGVTARFTGFVRVPGAFIVRGRGGPHTTAFDAVSEGGASVLGQGVLTL